MKIDPMAGRFSEPSRLVDISKLIQAYYDQAPDLDIPEQMVVFGTSGHRGSSFKTAFNETHILAIAQAICDYRAAQKIRGPLFLGFDTHALSQPAFKSVLEVLAANQVQTMIAEGDEYTPTPTISHAILKYNRAQPKEKADGIVITPSHNPPDEGGIKYDPPNGGGADTSVTAWIEKRANDVIAGNMAALKRVSFEKAMLAPTTHRHDFMNDYIDDLKWVIDMNLLRESRIHFGIDPMGGAGVHYWEPIAERYRLNLSIINRTIDPTFRFIPVDWDGRIRMDPSSPYTMSQLVKQKDQFEIIAGCDTDHDRHGIIAKSCGLMSPNHYLTAAIFYLFQHRPRWSHHAAIGKTVVSSRMIDYVTAKMKKKLFETPVGFKWFVNGLFDGSLAFAGEQSAGAVFSRMDGSVWTTDKDGIILALLAAEITARLGKDPGLVYRDLANEFGNPASKTIEAVATRKQKEVLKKISAEQIQFKELAGEKIKEIQTKAPGNHAPIGGVRVITEHGWFAARPSGTEDITKIYAESFLGEEHLQRILNEAQAFVQSLIG